MPTSPSIDGLTLSPLSVSGGKQRPGRTLETNEAPKRLKFEEDYKLHQKLSQGSYGIVYVAKHLTSGDEYGTYGLGPVCTLAFIFYFANSSSICLFRPR
jgi:hypothetical protein